MKFTFKTFMEMVDAEMNKLVGMDSEMIEDFSYYDHFLCGQAPKVTAKSALRNAGWEG